MAFFHREPEGKHRGYPEKNRQRINRHHDRANVENRRGIQSNDRPQTGGCAKQSAREVEQEQTCAGCEHRTEEANTKLVRAKNRGARAYGESDTRSLAEIGGWQAVRPHPIMSLVKREIGRCKKRKRIAVSAATKSHTARVVLM